MSTNTLPRRPNRTTLEIPPPLRERLRRLSDLTGRPQAHLIIEALEHYLLRREKEARK